MIIIIQFPIEIQEKQNKIWTKKTQIQASKINQTWSNRGRSDQSAMWKTIIEWDWRRIWDWKQNWNIKGAGIRQVLSWNRIELKKSRGDGGLGSDSWRLCKQETARLYGEICGKYFVQEIDLWKKWLLLLFLGGT